MGDRQFNPKESYGCDKTFLVMDASKLKDDIPLLKASIESEIVAFVPAKYRKHVRRFIRIHDAPKPSEAGWRYTPYVTVKTGKVDS